MDAETVRTLAAVIGPLAGVLIGSWLTSRRSKSERWLDVRRETYARYVRLADSARRFGMDIPPDAREESDNRLGEMFETTSEIALLSPDLRPETNALWVLTRDFVIERTYPGTATFTIDEDEAFNGKFAAEMAVFMDAARRDIGTGPGWTRRTYAPLRRRIRRLRRAASRRKRGVGGTT